MHSERNWQRLGFVTIIVMTIIGLLVSPDLPLSLIAAVPLAIGLALYWTLSSWSRIVRHLDWMALGLSLVTLAFGFLAALRLLPSNHALLKLLPPIAWLAKRLTFELNPNVAAGALVMLLPFCVAQVLWARRSAGTMARVRWGAALLASLIALATMPLTQSQAGFVALAAALGMLLILRFPGSALWKILAGLALLGLVLAIGYGFTIGWETVISRYLGDRIIVRLAIRAEIYRRALLLIGSYPFSGVGIGCFEPIVHELYPLFYMPGATVSSAHNLLLQVAVDLGIPGLLAYLLLLDHALRAAIRGCRRGNTCSSLCAALAHACLVALIALLIHGLLDSAQWANKLRFITWGVMGLAVALDRFAPRSPNEDEHQA